MGIFDMEGIRKANEKKLYNFRVRSLDGLLRLSRKLMSIRYILFHKEGESIRLVRIVDEEPRILRRPELLEKGYSQELKDPDGDGYCDACNELLDPTVECECNCHKEGVSGFFWNIRKFFIRIFRTNQS